MKSSFPYYFERITKTHKKNIESLNDLMSHAFYMILLEILKINPGNKIVFSVWYLMAAKLLKMSQIIAYNF